VWIVLFQRQFQKSIREADVILGADVRSGCQFLLYGRNALEEDACADSARPLRVFYVSLDRTSDELASLVALVQSIKGRHDYRHGPEEWPRLHVRSAGVEGLSASTPLPGEEEWIRLGSHFHADPFGEPSPFARARQDE
jgi:hypothetical protein